MKNSLQSMFMDFDMWILRYMGFLEVELIAKAMMVWYDVDNIKLA